MKDYVRTARKITWILFLAQSLGSAGFIAAFTVNALVGAELSGPPGIEVFEVVKTYQDVGQRLPREPEPRSPGAPLHAAPGERVASRRRAPRSPLPAR